MNEKRDQTEKQVMAAVANIAGMDAKTLSLDTEVVKDLNLDSLAMYELVIELEQAYSLQISDEEIERIRTIGDMVDYIVREAG